MTQSLTRRRLSGIISDSNRDAENSVTLSRTSNQRTLKDNAKKFFNPKAPQLPESGVGSRETSSRYKDVRNNDNDNDDITKLKSNLEVLSVASGSPSSDRQLLLSTRQSQSNESHKYKNDLTLPALSNNSYHNSMSSESSTRRCSDSQKSNQLSKISMSRLEVGLQNLGNTCFMNSSLQCLLHIEPLVSYFLNGKYHRDLNTSSPMKGSLALSFAQLIQEVTASTNGAVVSPVHFQKAVSCHAPHLLDFQQQDCQEFLRFLLDGMSEDLCRSPSKTSTRRKSISTAVSGTVQVTSPHQQQHRSSSPQTVATRGSESSVRRFAILHAMPVKADGGAGGGGAKQVEGNAKDEIEPQLSQSSPASLDKMQGSPSSSKEISNNNNSSSSNNNSSIVEGGHIPSSSVTRLRAATASSRTQSDDVADRDRLPKPRESETAAVAAPLSNQDSEGDQWGGAASTRHGSRGMVHRRRRRLSKSGEMGGHSHSHGHSSNQSSHRTAVLQANQDPESPSNSISTASTALMTSMDSDMESSTRSTKSLRKSFLVPPYNETTNSLTTTTSTAIGTSLPAMITDGSGSGSGSAMEVSDDLKKIYEESRKGWENYLQRNDSVVTDIFAGQLQGTVQCYTCKNRSHCFDPFLDISVPIPKISELRTTTTSTTKSWRRSSSSGDAVKCTLDECLEKFSSEEVLEGDNAVMCEVCKKKTKSVKRLSIYQHPKVLVIHIKRFRYTSFLREKLSTDVSFPLTGLDLTPYLSKDIIPPPPPPTPPPSSTATAATAATGGSWGGPRSVLYDLVGVSHHSGSMNGGHYIAHVDTTCGSGGASRWMCFNDARVSSVNVSNLSGPSAYVLFYRLREER